MDSCPVIIKSLSSLSLGRFMQNPSVDDCEFTDSNFNLVVKILLEPNSECPNWNPISRLKF